MSQDVSDIEYRRSKLSQRWRLLLARPERSRQAVGIAPAPEHVALPRPCRRVVCPTGHCLQALHVLAFGTGRAKTPYGASDARIGTLRFSPVGACQQGKRCPASVVPVPGTAYFPAGHGVHSAQSVEGDQKLARTLKFPVGQFVQDTVPLEAAYLPDSQPTQTVPSDFVEFGLYLPLGHVSQAASNLCSFDPLGATK